MVSLRMMGWGLVLLENSSAVAVAAVTAAAVAAAAVAAAAGAAEAVAAAVVDVGVHPQKVCFSFKHIRYGHFFKGVFSENTLYTFSRF